MLYLTHIFSEVVQERFRQLYSIPVIAVNRLTFEGMVLEFIKLIQSAMVIFNLFDSAYDLDGLLCDTMVDSVQRWTLEIGEKLPELHLEVCNLALPQCCLFSHPVIASRPGA
jgi:hypothetical protein